MSRRTPRLVETSHTLTSTHEEVRQARLWLGRQLQDLGLEPDPVTDVLLAVGEVLNNVLEHAYQGKPGPVEITLRGTFDHVEVRVRDEAPPTFAGAGGPISLPETLAEGGYGLYLINKLMDEVHYEPALRGGTIVRLIKRTSGYPGKAA